MTDLYNGLNPFGHQIVEANYVEDLFLQVGDNTFETWDVAVDQVIKAGTVMGLDEATRRLVVCDDGLGPTAGSVPFAVATHAYDTSASGINKVGSMSVLVRSMGKLNANALSMGGSHTVDTVRQALSLRGLSIDTTYYTAAY